jgi:hypothetical protein
MHSSKRLAAYRNAWQAPGLIIKQGRLLANHIEAIKKVPLKFAVVGVFTNN